MIFCEYEDSSILVYNIYFFYYLGGAERLIVDAAVELASHGHNVHIFTSHHDKTRCFEETIAGEEYSFCSSLDIHNH